VGALGRPSRLRLLSGEEPDALISRSTSCRSRRPGGWLGRIEGLGEAKRPDDDLLFFKREGGGWPRLNQMFGGELDGVLQQFEREVRAA